MEAMSMVAFTLDLVMSLSSSIAEPLTLVNRPCTLLMPRWRTVKPMVLWAGSICHSEPWAQAAAVNRTTANRLIARRFMKSPEERIWNSRFNQRCSPLYGVAQNFALLCRLGLFLCGRLRFHPIRFAVLLHELGNQAGPSGLMRSSKTAAVVPVEVLVEQWEVLPVRIGLEKRI